MKQMIAFMFLSLQLTGCGRYDAELQRNDAALHRNMVGSWSRGPFFKMTLAPDGSFVSDVAHTNGLTYLTYQGTWGVRDGQFIATTTNCIAQNTTNFEAVGSVNRYKIIQADDSNLVYGVPGQTISLKRR